MRIVVDARIIATGTGRYVERLLYYLQEIDVENQYVVLLRKRDMGTWQPTSPRFSKVEADYEIYSRAAQVTLAAQLNKLKADLVHFPFQMVPVLYRKPYVVTIHDLTQLRFKNPGKTRSTLGYSLKQKQLALNFRLGIQGARAVITPSKYVKYDLLGFMPKVAKKSITVTYEGADSGLGDMAGQPKSDLGLNDTKYIFYLGTAHAHKNIETLLRGFELLRQNRPDLHLVLGGKQDAIYKEFLRRTKADTLPGVHVLGYVTDEQLIWLYRHSLAYVFPSLSEGFGLPALEAMSFGCPVASSNATCLPEVYEDGALYFDPHDPAELAKAVGMILDDESLRKNLIKNGHVQVAKYSWKRMAEQTLAVYHQAVSKK